MRIIACIFAILSGIVGLFGGSFQAIVGSGISLLGGNDTTMNQGEENFLLSWLVIILGGVSLKFPKLCGIGLIIISIYLFSGGNIFSAPFAFIGGIFGLLSDPLGKSKQQKPSLQESNTKNQTEDIPLTIDSTPYLNQLSQLLNLKEKRVITDEVFEKERSKILSKLQNDDEALTPKATPLGYKDTFPTFKDGLKLNGEITKNSKESHNRKLQWLTGLLGKKWKWTNKDRVTIGTLLILIIIYFIYSLVSPTQPTQPSQSQTQNNKLPTLDTVISNVNIGGKFFNIDIFNLHREGPDSLFAPDDSAKIFQFFKQDGSIPISSYIFYLEEGQMIGNYDIYKIHNGIKQPLNNPGLVYLLINTSYGGSGSSSTRYLISLKDGSLAINKLFKTSGELDFIFYNINDQGGLILKGIMGEGETHFGDHQYFIERFTLNNGSISEELVGKTTSKYPCFANSNETPKQILDQIKSNEPSLMRSIDTSKYHEIEIEDMEDRNL